jgi:thiol:disulfide interchange protein DsbD
MGERSLTICIPFLAVACLLAGARTGGAQDEVPKPVHVKVIPAVDRYPAGGSYPFILHVTVDDPWHVNSDKPLEDFLIPTSAYLEPPEGVSAGRFTFPQGHMRKFAFSDTELSVFEREFYLAGSLTVSADVAPGRQAVKGGIEYQACNDALCLAPQTAPFEIPVEIAAAGEKYESLNRDLVEKVAASTGVKPTGAGPLGSGLGSRGLFFTFLLVFLGGLALNLTPCVYPLIPITIGFFGGQSTGRKGGLVAHAILYVLGMSITYSVLGVFAALTGSLLGQALQNPYVLVFIALVMVALSLSMFGFYDITVPQFIASGAGKAKQGYLGTTFMGLTVGIIAAPCIGPFVLGLLTYVGERRDPLMGFLMFFVLALGLGTPFLFLALFSGGINKLPRSGDWMEWVRRVFGVVLLGMAVYFLSPLMSKGLLTIVIILLAVASGLYLGFIEGSGKGRPVFIWVKRLVGVAAVVTGILFVLPGGEARQGPAWVPYSDSVLEEAKAAGRAVMIDFSAEWCIPCKELDHYTFSDPSVVELSKRITAVKADLTSFSSPEAVAVRERFGVKGVPTVVFLDADGHEREDLRFVGFIEAGPVIEKLTDVVGGKEMGSS